LDSKEIKVCCEQGEVTCTSLYFLPLTSITWLWFDVSTL
jgi:hypothetical protein